jgi:hypothetical protein
MSRVSSFKLAGFSYEKALIPLSTRLRGERVGVRGELNFSYFAGGPKALEELLRKVSSIQQQALSPDEGEAALACLQGTAGGGCPYTRIGFS